MPLPPSWVQIRPVTFGSAAATLTGIPAMPGIYRVVCLPMKMAYVGQTHDLVKRCLEHQVDLREGTHTNPRLLGAYRKFGPKAFCFQVLEIWTERWTPDCLSPAEQRWMDAHGKKALFNVRPAGSDAWLEATGHTIGGKVISNAKAKTGGKPSTSRDDAGPSSKVEEDNRPLGRENTRCATCGGGFFKQRPKGASGPKEVWQPCICQGLAQQLQNKAVTRGQGVGTHTSKDWRNKMPGKRRRD